MFKLSMENDLKKLGKSPKNISNSNGDKSASPSVRESKIIPIRLYYYSDTNEASEATDVYLDEKKRVFNQN